MATIKSVVNRIRELPPVSARDNFVTLLPVLMIAAAAVQVVSALWGVNWFQSHEREMYPVRLVEYIQTFKCGSCFPRWCPDLYGGYGYPLFNYYQPGLFATAAAIMALLAATPILALKLAVAGFAICGGYGTYRLALGETQRKDAALLAAIVFVYLPYRFCDLFVRGDLAEFAAYSLVPFVFWGYRELGRAEPKKVPLIGTLTALCHAATLFCHIIIGLYTTEAVGVMLLVTALRHQGNMLPRTVLGSCTLIFAIGMTAVYIGPAWFERGLVTLENVRAQIWSPTNNLILPWRLVFESGPSSIGLAPIVGAIAAAASFIVPEVRAKAAMVIGWWLPAILMIPLIVKSGSSEWFWNWLPLGSFIQFPWRLLGFIGLFSSIGIAVTWTLLVSEGHGANRWIGVMSVALIVACSEQPYRAFTHGPLDVPDMLMTPFGIRLQGVDAVTNVPYTTVVADEYLPVTVQNARRFPPNVKLLMVSGKSRMRVSQPCPLRYLIEAEAMQPSTLNLQVFDFPGWKVETLAGSAKVQKRTSSDGLIQLYVPVPGRYRIRVYFGLTTFRAVASAISLAALLLVYPILWGFNHFLERAPGHHGSAPATTTGSV